MPDSHHITNDSKFEKTYQDAHGNVPEIVKKEREKAEKETAEVLAAGQEDEKKAVKEVERIETETQKEEQVARDDAMNKLDMKKKFRASYKSELAKTLSEMLTMLDWVKGWTADVVVTNGQPITIYGHAFQSKDGILLVVKTRKGNVMHQGMLVTGEPALDYAGLYNIALQVENTMDKARGLILDGTGGNGDASGIVDTHGRDIPSTANP